LFSALCCPLLLLLLLLLQNIIVIISFEAGNEFKVTILWNQYVRTDKTISNNKPYILICDNKEETRMLMDAAIPTDRNAIKKEADRILKCKDLIIEIQCMWNVQAKVIPVKKGGGATGTVSISLRQHLRNIGRA